jgi:hypothetical protein
MHDASVRDVVVSFLTGPSVPNVGGLDRVWRAVVGPLLLVGVVAALAGVLDVGTGAASVAGLAVAAAVGAIVTHSAVTCRCRVNHLTGVDTSARSG